jgi:hypothetical protein
MVIDAIKDMLITQVIEAGIKWLLSLLIPGAGFIKAIMAIKDVIVFFVKSPPPAREQGDSFCLNKPLNGALRCE